MQSPKMNKHSNKYKLVHNLIILVSYLLTIYWVFLCFELIEDSNNKQTIKLQKRYCTNDISPAKNSRRYRSKSYLNQSGITFFTPQYHKQYFNNLKLPQTSKTNNLQNCRKGIVLKRKEKINRYKKVLYLSLFRTPLRQSQHLIFYFLNRGKGGGQRHLFALSKRNDGLI